ncbi:MAG TPA: FHA domain-containing protein [Bryobacteraceae bacterium]|nr:FHA domain-containing protein [Bryobacteraceae bacterium]
MAASPINTAIARLLRRAEEEDPATLAETFVDVNALFARLSSRDSQVMFGRRGTGKTHALKYLGETLRSEGGTVVYLDLRLLGSSGSLYTDSGVSVAEAGTRLLVDVLQGMHDALLEQALNGTAADSSDGDQLLIRLDKLGGALGEIEIVGQAEERQFASTDSTSGTDLGIEAPRLSAFARIHEGQRLAAEREMVMRGVARHRVHFGSVASALQKLIPSLPGGRLWLIMDEWSHVSMDLQPLLADLIRHCLLPVPGVTVKFAAIETRTILKLDRTDGSYLGIELGADVAADIDLDEFMVFTAAGDSATEFFAQLFQRHIRAASSNEDDFNLAAPEDFVASAFAGEGAFHELVRAAEGVPRDGINVLSKAALHAADSRITLRHVREAARGWYLSDKQATLRTRPSERDLLHWIIDEVIEERGVRGFLLRQGSESHLIDWLYDARLIHLIKRSIAAKDQAGVRFDAYALDYGCYVDLLATRDGGPQGLLAAKDEDYVDVPDDDLDRIRGAILDLDEFIETDAGGLPRHGPPGVTLRGHAREGSMIIESPVAFDTEKPPAEWCLLVEARHGVVVVPLGKRPIRIGSSSSDQIRIRAESTVPRHAVIELSDGQPVITADRGSVYVNGLKVASTRQLRHRDSLSLGEAELLIFASGEIATE